MSVLVSVYWYELVATPVLCWKHDRSQQESVTLVQRRPLVNSAVHSHSWPAVSTSTSTPLAHTPRYPQPRVLVHRVSHRASPGASHSHRVAVGLSLTLNLRHGVSHPRRPVLLPLLLPSALETLTRDVRCFLLCWLSAAGVRQSYRHPRARDASAGGGYSSGPEGCAGVAAGGRFSPQLRRPATFEGPARGLHRHTTPGWAAHGLEGAVRCCAVLCGAVLCCAVRCGAVRYSAVQCGAVRCCVRGEVAVLLFPVHSLKLSCQA